MNDSTKGTTMSDEDEVGQEFDRVLRSVMMGGGQVRETLARAQAAKDQRARDAALEQIRERERETTRLREMVSRDSFWKSANGERVANAATYGATLYNTDPNAAAVYDIVREKAHDLYGINVDRLRAAHPESEDARHNALLHAVDDRLAATRDRQESEKALANGVDLEQEANAVREDNKDDEAEVGAGSEPDDSRFSSESDAADLEERAEGKHVESEQLEAGANRADSRADSNEQTTREPRSQTAREQVKDSYPQTAKVSLGQSRNSGRPKAKAKKQTNTLPRTSGLSR